MELSAPKKVIFLISLILGIFSILSVFIEALRFGIEGQSMWTAIIAWALLAAGNMMKGV